ncbi:Predicted ester cyclase [Methylobacterium sp. ap11]|jgi:predicted ester cyclase|uniref:ester cyclase n=1 Tax=Methylobacterium sp. ap11 TaxID=1761799 RepID=UPI0008B4795B|nr:ester cyclase [Methylobacterium sp. ap11]SEO40875.1 Predicted ester cyclase [Methylobacterium sp. ap11]
MSTDANKDLARAYFAAFLARDEAWWQRHIAPDFVRHDPGLDFAVRGPEGVRRLGEVLHGGVTGMALPIDEVIAEGDKVLVRLRFQGRHTGGLMGLAPSGHAIDIAVMDLFRIVDGRLVEHWALLDNLGLLKQVGALPA